MGGRGPLDRELYDAPLEESGIDRDSRRVAFPRKRHRSAFASEQPNESDHVAHASRVDGETKEDVRSLDVVGRVLRRESRRADASRLEDVEPVSARPKALLPLLEVELAIRTRDEDRRPWRSRDVRLRARLAKIDALDGKLDPWLGLDDLHAADSRLIDPPRRRHRVRKGAEGEARELAQDLSATSLERFRPRNLHLLDGNEMLVDARVELIPGKIGVGRKDAQILRRDREMRRGAAPVGDIDLAVGDDARI